MNHALRPWLTRLSALCFAFKLLPSSVLFKSVEVYIFFSLRKTTKWFKDLTRINYDLLRLFLTCFLIISVPILSLSSVTVSFKGVESIFNLIL